MNNEVREKNEGRPKAALKTLLVISVFATGVAATGAIAQAETVEMEENPGATVSSSNVSIGANGSTGQTSVTVNAQGGMSVADVVISVDTTVAEISSVDEGTDVDSSRPTVLFEVMNRTPDSVLIQYTNIAASDSVEDFELAVVEFEANTDDGETVIGTNATNLVDSDTNPYETVNEIEGNLTVGALFTEPLPGFAAPPTNTGELDPALYEDVNGDGDGLDPTQTVNLWSELVVNPQDFDDLTRQQIDSVDWNGDGQLTPADAVSLWTEQVLAG